MQGQLFTQDFLLRGIESTLPWRALTDDTLERFTQARGGIYAELRADSTINEAQTEHLVIERVLVELGWADDYLPQVNLSVLRDLSASGRGTDTVSVPLWAPPAGHL